MQDDVKFAIQRKDDAFAEAVDLSHPTALDRFDRWCDRSHQKGTDDAQPLHGLVDDPLPQGVAIRLDIGEFRHDNAVGSFTG